MSDKPRVDKPLVIVTGGTKGIGRALLFAFAGEGFDLVTCARNGDDLEQLKQALQDSAQLDVRVHTLQADLSQREQVDKLGDYVVSLQQPVASLINNTGVFLPGAVHDEPAGALEQQIDTNLYSAYHLTRKVLPLMMAQQRGHVFNICSTASNTAYTNGGSYCISKFALYGFSQVLRQEMKPHGIRVSSVLPGATLTNSWAGTDLPADRFMPPEDVASMVLAAFKLSPRSVVEDIILRPQLGDL